MKEGAPAGKRSIPEPCLPSAKEGGSEGREGILGGSPALSMERIPLLAGPCAPERFTLPSGPGSLFPDPVGRAPRLNRRTTWEKGPTFKTVDEQAHEIYPLSPLCLEKNKRAINLKRKNHAWYIQICALRVTCCALQGSS